MVEITLNIMQDFTRLDRLDKETRKVVEELISHNQHFTPEPSQPVRGVITREFTAWCGLCEEWEQDTAASIKEVQPRFIRAGWSKTRKHGWLCPKCSKKSTPAEK